MGFSETVLTKDAHVQQQMKRKRQESWVKIHLCKGGSERAPPLLVINTWNNWPGAHEERVLPPVTSVVPMRRELAVAQAAWLGGASGPGGSSEEHPEFGWGVCCPPQPPVIRPLPTLATCLQ